MSSLPTYWCTYTIYTKSVRTKYSTSGTYFLFLNDCFPSGSLAGRSPSLSLVLTWWTLAIIQVSIFLFSLLLLRSLSLSLNTPFLLSEPIPQYSLSPLSAYPSIIPFSSLSLSLNTPFLLSQPIPQSFSSIHPAYTSTIPISFLRLSLNHPLQFSHPIPESFPSLLSSYT